MKTFKRLAISAYALFMATLFILAFSGCKRDIKYVVQEKRDTIQIHDTVFVLRIDTIYVNSFQNGNNSESIKQAEAVSRLAQIKYYVAICDRNPKQKIYEHGWIKRALK